MGRVLRRMAGGEESAGGAAVTASGSSKPAASEEPGVLVLPKASIKRIMKLDPDTKQVGAVRRAERAGRETEGRGGGRAVDRRV